MINNKDPLIAAVQKVMQDSYAERNAVKVVNEKFGIQDRKALPHEYMGEWNAEYKSVLSEGIEALDEAALPKPPGTVKAVKALGPEERERRAALHHAESARHEGVYAKYDSQGKQGTRAAQNALERSTHHSEMAERYKDPDSHFKNLENRKMDFGEGGIHVYKEEALEEKVHPSKYSLKQKKLATVGKNVDPDDNPKTIGRADLKAASMGHASHIGEAKNMNNEETVNRNGKGNLQEPQTVASGKATISPEATSKNNNAPGPSFERTGRGLAPSAPQERTNAGISALNRPAPQAQTRSLANNGNTTQDMQRGAEQDKVGMKRQSAVAPQGAGAAGQQVGKPLAATGSAQAPEAGPNRGLGPKPAAPGSASAKPPLPKLRPAAAKVKAIRKQPIAGAAQRQGVAARPARNSTVLSRVKAIRYRDKNSIVGPGN